MTVKVRYLLENGSARVVGERPGGVHVIELGRPAAARTAPWRLRVAADGRPIDLRVAARGGIQTTTWEIYELIPVDGADRLGAHPRSRVVRDADAYERARARLYR